MKISVTVLGTVALILFLGALAPAQHLSQPLSVRQAAYNFDDDAALAENDDEADSSKQPASPAATKDASGCQDGCCPATTCDTCASPETCGTCDSCDSCGTCCCPGHGLGCLGFNTGGWVQAGITANGANPADRWNGPIMTNDRVGDLEMNQLWLYFERPINTQCGFDIGGRFDLLYGTDWRIADCYGNGLEDKMNGPDSFYGIALPQMYVEAGVGDFSVKMGRMAGILGYESVVPMLNFFYSHCYTLCYGEPVLITGMMGAYKLSDQVNLLAGFHNGWHQFENENGDLNFQGGVQWKSCDKQTSLAYCLDAGRNDMLALCDQYVHSIVLQQQLTCRLQYVFQSDYGYTNNIGGGEDADYYSINQYLLYKIDCKWSAGMRVEWFRDDDGTRVFGVGNLPDAKGWMGAPGYAGSFTELTMGLNWKPKTNMTFRPEIRWDWYNGPPNPNGPYPYPFDDGARTTQFTAACDFIMTF